MARGSERSRREGAGAAGRDGDLARQFEAAFARLQVQVEAACAAEEEWPAQVAAAVRAALAFAASEPAATSVLTTRAMTGGQEGFAQLDRMVCHFADALAPGREMRPGARALPEATEKTMVAGLASLIAQRLHVGDHAELPATAPGAIQFVLTPFVGPEDAKAAARRYGA